MRRIRYEWDVAANVDDFLLSFCEVFRLLQIDLFKAHVKRGDCGNKFCGVWFVYDAGMKVCCRARDPCSGTPSLRLNAKCA